MQTEQLINFYWRLSPAYDLTYNSTKGRRDLVLTINNKLSSDASYEDFVEVAKINKYFKDDKFKYYKMELLDTQKIYRDNIS